MNVLAVNGDRFHAGDTLVVAHLDTVKNSPGADDNASGVSMALNLARRFTGSTRLGIALVDLEETGQLGSRALAAQIAPPGLVICLEAVGFFSATPGTQSLPLGFGALYPETAAAVRVRDRRADFLVAVHRAASASFAQTWSAACAEHGVGGVLLRDRRWAGRSQAITRWASPFALDLDRSDHAPFWRARIPAVMLTGTAVLRNPAYHRPEDTADTLDYPRMAAAAAALADAVAAAIG